MKLKTQIKACLGVKAFSPILSHYYFRDRMKHKTHPNQQQQTNKHKTTNKNHPKNTPHTTTKAHHTTTKEKTLKEFLFYSSAVPSTYHRSASEKEAEVEPYPKEISDESELLQPQSTPKT